MSSSILVLMNPHSGSGNAMEETFTAVREHWEGGVKEVLYQFSNSKEDGREKIRRAADRGVTTVLLVGGDGLLNSCLEPLMENDLTVGVIPAGSMNAFAKHLQTPPGLADAVQALKSGSLTNMDVATANDIPWIVTCSFAWETSIAEKFEQLPTRGMLSYVFSAARSSIDYMPQPHVVMGEEGDESRLEEPMVLTAVNISDYALVQLISSKVTSDDGRIELVWVEKQDVSSLVSQVPALLQGDIDTIPQISCHSYEKCTVQRNQAGPIQIDGERVETEANVEIRVQKRALKVLAPKPDALA